MIRKFSRTHVIVAAALASLAVGGTAAADNHVKTIAPVEQPDAASLAPGLAVTYYFHLFNTVGEIPQWARTRKGTRGDPFRSR